MQIVNDPISILRRSDKFGRPPPYIKIEFVPIGGNRIQDMRPCFEGIPTRWLRWEGSYICDQSGCTSQSSFVGQLQRQQNGIVQFFEGCRTLCIGRDECK